MAESPFKPGSLVFAKVKGHPAWPAKVTAKRKGKYSVVFYGTFETGLVKMSELCPYSQENKEKFEAANKKRKGYKESLYQIENTPGIDTTTSDFIATVTVVNTLKEESAIAVRKPLELADVSVIEPKKCSKGLLSECDEDNYTGEIVPQILKKGGGGSSTNSRKCTFELSTPPGSYSPIHLISSPDARSGSGEIDIHDKTLDGKYEDLTIKPTNVMNCNIAMKLESPFLSTTLKQINAEKEITPFLIKVDEKVGFNEDKFSKVASHTKPISSESKEQTKPSCGKQEFSEAMISKLEEEEVRPGIRPLLIGVPNMLTPPMSKPVGNCMQGIPIEGQTMTITTMTHGPPLSSVSTTKMTTMRPTALISSVTTSNMTSMRTGTPKKYVPPTKMGTTGASRRPVTHNMMSFTRPGTPMRYVSLTKMGTVAPISSVTPPKMTAMRSGTPMKYVTRNMMGTGAPRKQVTPTMMRIIRPGTPMSNISRTKMFNLRPGVPLSKVTPFKKMTSMNQSYDPPTMLSNLSYENPIIFPPPQTASPVEKLYSPHPYMAPASGSASNRPVDNKLPDGRVLPPGLTITRPASIIDKGAFLSLPTLGTTLLQLGDGDGRRRLVQFKLTESQIRALDVLGVRE